MQKHTGIKVIALLAAVAFVYLLAWPPAQFSGLDMDTQFTVLVMLFLVATFPITVFLAPKIVRATTRDSEEEPEDPGSDHLPRPTL